MRWRRILAIVLAVVALAVVGGYWYERPLLLTGTGYAAHNACAVTQLAGRDNPEADLPPNPLVPYLRSTVTSSGAKTSILGALAGQEAFFTRGYGCTLADERPSFGTIAPMAADLNPMTTMTQVESTPEIDAAIATAFGDELSAEDQAALGTRAIVVLRDGQLVGERYADGFDLDTRQLGWSMTKSIGNLLVGILVHDGTVKITDDHLRPEWTDDRTKITIDDLMRGTSGLSWDETYSLGTPITKMLYVEKDMAAYVAAQPLAHPVGSYQQYSSGGTNLLCSVLQDKVGMGPDLPQQLLFSKLGIASAVMEPDAAGTPVCSSYLWATPRDWAALGQFALQEGNWQGHQLLPDGWMTDSTTVKPVQTTEEVGYAAAWWVNQLPDGTLADPKLPADAYWMSGHDGQRVIIVPSAQLVVARLGFSPTIDPADLRTSQLVADLIAAP